LNGGTMPRSLVALATALTVLLVPSVAAAFDGTLAGVPSVHHGRATLPLIARGKVRDVRLARGWRIVHRTVRLDLGGLRIGDRLRVPRSRKRVVIVRRGTVVSFRALAERLSSAQKTAGDASTALSTFVSTRLDRPGAESLRTTLNLLDQQLQSLAAALEGERQGIVAVAGPARDATLVGQLQGAEDASHTASGQLEQAVTQLDDALSLLPPGTLNLPLQSVSAVPALAGSALTYLKQSLPPVGNLLQAILAGGG
jgi:hypothetical protein